MPLKYKIGCDPEFSILNHGQRVSAADVIKQLFKGSDLLSDEDEEVQLNTPGGVFGCDGCDATGELRPNPDLKPAKVVGNMAECFKAFMSRGRHLELTTLSLWAPVGGHIHLELPEDKRNLPMERLEPIHKKLMSYYLPILMGEHKTNIQIRLKSYGKISDCRAERQVPTLEVRAPSAEWLTSPKIAQAVLSYMSCVWHEIWEHPGNLDRQILLRTKRQEEALQELATSNFERLTKSLLRSIAKNIRTFELYPQFKDEIEFVLRPDKVLKEKKKHNFLINSGWGFGTQTIKFNKKQFLRKPQVKEGSASNLGLAHNGDINTGALVDTLAARVIAGFRLKHNYYFYGLKAGIEEHLVSSEGRIFKAPEPGNLEDVQRLKTNASRMEDKARDRLRQEEVLRLDFKAAKIVREKRSIVAVGVPLKERQSGRFGPTLNLIWALEKEALKPLELAVNPKAPGVPVLHEDLVPEDEGAFPPDTDSQGRRLAIDALRALETEARDEEVANRIEAIETYIGSGEIFSKALLPLITSPDPIENLRNTIERLGIPVWSGYGSETRYLRCLLAFDPRIGEFISIGANWEDRHLGWVNGGNLDLPFLPSELPGLYWVNQGSLAPQTGVRTRINDSFYTYPARNAIPGTTREILVIEEAEPVYTIKIRAGDLNEMRAEARLICHAIERQKENTQRTGTGTSFTFNSPVFVST